MTARSHPGLFVVLEGGDGAGKSTQGQRLKTWLSDAGHGVVMTYEPGDTAIGRSIRQMVLDPDSGDPSPRTEALLYAADKAQHVDEVVRPALLRGDVVVCDRYVDSMVAYQGAGRVLDAAEVHRIADWATGGLVPDLTVLLDVEVHRGLGEKVERDRLESAGDDFHERVRQHFLALAAAAPQRYLVLDARESREAIESAIRERVEALLA
ncbi:MAG TPA: dTMP kinase [Propionibacteriaceae bacterium]|nr:dTMP kinase [Propionibacteriaceae bacterium]HPZ49390.1 dTMP kinase [Propionibacteriaceae bacterium]